MARVIDDKLLSNLSKTQRLKLEREKKQDLETEYQKKIIDRLTDAIEVAIASNENLTLNASKLEILKNEYEIISRLATQIEAEKVKKSYVDTNNDKSIVDYKSVNKYGKTYSDIAGDLEKHFVEVLEARFKNLELRQKLEKEVAKEQQANNYKDISAYLTELLQNASCSMSAALESMTTDRVRRAVASDLMLDYTPAYIKAYDKAVKEITAMYKGTAKVQKKLSSQNQGKPLSIWWRIAIGCKVFESLWK